jgi:hypothetical protein
MMIGVSLKWFIPNKKADYEYFRGVLKIGRIYSIGIVGLLDQEKRWLGCVDPREVNNNLEGNAWQYTFLYHKIFLV